MKILYSGDEATIDQVYDPAYPIFLVGERHTDLVGKEAFAKSLPMLRKKGIRHLALELFKESQEAIDQFLRGEYPRQQFIKSGGLVNKEWELLRPGVTEREVRILEAAREVEMLGFANKKI